MEKVTAVKCWFHKWSNWEQYLWVGYTYGNIFQKLQEPKKISERRQRRHCEICNKEEDELV